MMDKSMKRETILLARDLVNTIQYSINPMNIDSQQKGDIILNACRILTFEMIKQVSFEGKEIDNCNIFCDILKEEIKDHYLQFND